MTALPSDPNRSMTRMISISLLLPRIHLRPVTRKTPKRTSPHHPSLQLATTLAHITVLRKMPAERNKSTWSEGVISCVRYIIAQCTQSLTFLQGHIEELYRDH